MERIVDVHYPGLKKALLQEALEVFFNLREVPGLKKKPSTSELLDWLKLLLAEDIAPEALRSQDRKAFIPPLHGALLRRAGCASVRACRVHGAGRTVALVGKASALRDIASG